MGSSAPIHEDAGFATPSAVVISLAVATIALAVESRAILEVHASEADYARISAEIELDGAETLAVEALYGGDGLPQPLAKIDVAGKPVEVVAEAEGGKLGLADAAKLSFQALHALGAREPSIAQQRLSALATSPDALPSDVAKLDPSPRWRRCARSWVSPYGSALSVGGPSPYTRAGAHAGEVWRIVAHTPDGWTEDRTLRITGEEHAPARIIDSLLYRSPPGDEPCRFTAALPQSPKPATP